ncbi:MULTISPECIES: hypothetical protein [Bacillus amyloliquefaciens group]|uniref:hypothetical protein n=1 Tax=Bacillus amyloliquefaciens group TaxID=1938374 RepID=UPI00073B775D|nr:MULTISPECIES: hypothetical protein [Bacillus amyloliquefaciens group]KTF59799.1 hypothetical protein AR691_13780 [Bacillus amyloliquefaciens]
MNKQEELMLLGVLLYDVRLNWSDEVISRLEEAKKLAAKNGFADLESKIEKVLQREYECYNKSFRRSTFDGREFRGDYESLLGDQSLEGKSDEFLRLVRDLCTCGDSIFPGWYLVNE